MRRKENISRENCNEKFLGKNRKLKSCERTRSGNREIGEEGDDETGSRMLI